MRCLVHIAWAGLVVLMLGGTHPASAQPASFEGGLGLRATSYLADPDASALDAFGLGVAAHTALRLYDVALLQIEGGVDYLGPLCYDTDAACASPQPSGASTFVASGAVGTGLRLPFPGARSFAVPVAARVLLGREWLTGGIGDGDCLNCTTDLTLDGGPFLEASLDVAARSHLRLRVGYRTYTASDRRGQLVLDIVSQQ